MLTLAMDAEGSVREYDKNGNLHVQFSHLTKVQIRPYYGEEIPDFERLRLDPKKIYKGYCPAEELGKAETIRSTNGIPIQLQHHPDYADAPALETRVGSTGTDGAFHYPYLDNSLHITVQKAIDRIKDGSMRELSLAYRYTPDFTPGETPEGEAYDFVMRDISANHVALVEQGRAGRDVLVEDHELKEELMDDDVKTTDAPNAEVEKKEVAIAEAIGEAAEALQELHENGEGGEMKDVTDTQEDDGGDAVAALLQKLVDKGLSPEAAQEIEADLRALVSDSDEEGAADEGEADPELEAIKKAGLEDASPEMKEVFLKGLRMGKPAAAADSDEEGAADEECAEDSEEAQDEDEGCASDSEEGAPEAVAQDAALKKIEARIVARFAAIDECKPTLGNVRINAYDSAESVYLAALKQEGVRTEGMSRSSARAAYRAFMQGKNRGVKRVVAQDSAPRTKMSAISQKLSKIRKGA